LYFKSILKKFKFFLFFYLLQINIFLVFSNHFDVLMSKIIFKKLKKYDFNVFWHEKLFEKQPQSQPQPNFQTSKNVRFY